MRPRLECTGLPALWAVVCLVLQCLAGVAGEPVRLGPGVSEFGTPVGPAVQAETVYTLPDGRKVVVRETTERAAAAVPCEVRANVPAKAAPPVCCATCGTDCKCGAACACDAVAAERDAVQPRPGRVAGADMKPVVTADSLLAREVDQPVYNPRTGVVFGHRVMTVRAYLAAGYSVEGLPIPEEYKAMLRGQVAAARSPPITYTPIPSAPAGGWYQGTYYAPMPTAGGCANGQCAAPPGQPARGMSFSAGGPFGGGFRFGVGAGAPACAGGG